MDDHSQSGSNSRMRRWRRRLVGLGLLILLLVGFAPTIVSQTPLREHVLRWAVRDYPGRLSAESLGLSWFSPLVVRGLKLSDIDGEPLAEVAELTVERSLLALAWNPSDLGTLRIEEPQIQIREDEQGFNVWRTLEPLLTRDSESTLDQFEVEVVSGQVQLRDRHGATWEVEDAHISLRLDFQPQLTWQLTAKGRYHEGTAGDTFAAATRSFALDVQQKVAAGVPSWAFQCQELPLRPILAAADILPARDPRGHLSGSGEIAWDAQNRRLAATAETLTIAGPSWKQLDPAGWPSDTYVSPGNLTLTGALMWSPEGLALQQLTARTSWARLTGSGELALPESFSDVAAALRELTGKPFEVEGTVDVARMAADAPQLLRFRSDLTLEAGELQLEARTEPDAATPRVQLAVSSSAVRGLHAGRTLLWEQPLEIEVTAAVSDDAVRFERVTCRSDFLTVSGNGTVDSGRLEAQGDLDALHAHLSEFLQWDAVRLAGRFEGSGSWGREAGQWFGDITADLHDVVLEVPGKRPWSESHLQCRLVADVAGNPVANTTQLNSAQLRIDSGDDHLAADLLEPVALRDPHAEWPLRMAASGDAGRWLARLQWLVGNHVSEAGGNFDFVAEGAFGRSEVWVSTSRLTAENARLVIGDWRLDEPAIAVQLAGTWLPAEQTLDLKKPVLQTTTVAARAERLQIDWKQQPPLIDTDLSIRADLARLQEIFAPRDAAPSYRIAGQATGKLAITHRPPVTRGRWDFNVRDLVYAEPSANAGSTPGTLTTRFHEPQVTLAGAATWNRETESILVESCEARAGESLAVSLAGTVVRPASDAAFDVRGTLEYDLETLATRLRLPPEFRLVGRSSQPVALRGHWKSSAETSVVPVRQWEGTANFAWDTIDAYGIQVGPGTLQSQLAGGLLTINPLRVALGQGTLNVTPRLDFRTEPPVWSAAPGQILTQAKLTEEMCHTWMRFVAPLLAEATRAEGTFSLSVSEARIPWGRWQDGRVDGVLQMHSTRVGPGPLARDILAVAQEISSVLKGRTVDLLPRDNFLELPEQPIVFRLQDGFVEHQQLLVRMGDVTLRTRGRVAVEPPHALNLVASVPVQESWIANRPNLAVLRGQTIDIPIGGNLGDPRLDRRALEGLSRQMLEGTPAACLTKAFAACSAAKTTAK